MGRPTGGPHDVDSGPKAQRPGTAPAPSSAVRLYWLPLGAGGSPIVRINGRIYERLTAVRQRRTPLRLFHAALQVEHAGRPHVIELTPVPPGNPAAHGIVAQGPVGSHHLARLRVFRYALRCWPDGVIPDVEHAVSSPMRLTTDVEAASRLLDAVTEVPTLVWGRDERRTGEMWNSNSVIAWLIARSGIPIGRARLPLGGRAPGWDAGFAVAGVRA